MAPSTRGTREEILAQAVEVASTQGLEGLTIGGLAAKLGLSKSGLFGHFGSKQELQVATVQEAVRIFMRDVVEPALAQRPGAARLRALCEGYIEHLERPGFPGGCFLAAAAAEFDGRPGPDRDAVREGIAGWIDGLEQEARGAGVEDPRQLAFEVYSFALAANLRSQLLDDERVFALARTALRERLPQG
jgi:AcrR family transcriptional regulator